MNELTKLQELVDDPRRTWGIYAEDLDNRTIYAYNPERVFETASSIKFPIMLAVLDQVQKGKLKLKQAIRVKKRHSTEGSGILASLYLDRPFTLYNVITLMIIVSDNSATNTLIDLLGREKINRYIVSLGVKNTKLITDHVGFKRGYTRKTAAMGESTAKDLAILMKSLKQGKLLDAKTTKTAFQILKNQHYSSLGRELPGSLTLGDNKTKLKTFANKTGSITFENDDYFSVSSDVAYIETKRGRRYVVAVMSEGQHDRSKVYSVDAWQPRQFGRIGKALFDYLESK